MTRAGRRLQALATSMLSVNGKLKLIQFFVGGSPNISRLSIIERANPHIVAAS